jgi:hypothetical protein
MSAFSLLALAMHYAKATRQLCGTTMGTRTETELQMVERHVRRGEIVIAKQHVIIARLEVMGMSTTEAEELLKIFKDLQVEHLLHLARLKL